MKNGTAVALGVAGLAASVGSALRVGRVGSRASSATLAALSRYDARRSREKAGLLLQSAACTDGQSALRVYHVTRTDLLPRIRRAGLVPNPENVSPSFDGVEESHLAMRVFFSVGNVAMLKWWDALEWWGSSTRENGVTLLRIRPDRVSKWAPLLRWDNAGEPVHPCSFYLNPADRADALGRTLKRVPPEDLEIATLKPGMREGLPVGNRGNQETDAPIYQAFKAGREGAILWKPLAGANSTVTAGSRATLAELRARSGASRTETLRAVTEFILDEMQKGWWSNWTAEGTLVRGKSILRHDRPSAWDINCGWCEEWAVEAIRRLGGDPFAKHISDKDPHAIDLAALKTRKFGLPRGIFDDVAHVVLFLDGRFYDAQDLAGVDDPRQLQVVRGVTREAFLASQQGSRSLWSKAPDDPGIPAFAKWFKGSTVVNRGSHPMRVYRGLSPHHGLAKVQGRDDGMRYWTDSLDVARAYSVGEEIDWEDSINFDPDPGASVISGWIHIRKPFDMVADRQNVFRLRRWVEAKNWTMLGRPGKPPREPLDMLDPDFETVDHPEVPGILRARGYDGIVFRDEVGGEAHPTWVTFAPGQLWRDPDWDTRWSAHDLRGSMSRRST